jgi:pyridoxal biosynthesis lyase PdxS
MAEVKSSFAVKVGLAQMLKGGVIMDVVNEEQARIAEEAGAVAGACLRREPPSLALHRCAPHKRRVVSRSPPACCAGVRLAALALP